MPDDPPPILNYADQDTGKWILIARFDTEFTARLAASKLDADGIEPLVETSSNFYFSGDGPTTISVRTEEVAAAVSILKTSPAAPFLVDR